MSFDKYIYLYNYHLSEDIEYFHHPRKTLHASFQSIIPSHQLLLLLISRFNLV